ncbi:MAG: haloacid dehalogenase [Alphaproteobacteria bacterium]|nr:MAG: haloacid dehalogenase [Alphaproteobacteria bacterium]
MKLIVFDCDGTLVDGQHLILDAMQSACRTCDVSYAGDEAIRQIVGLSLMEAIGICYPKENEKTHLALKDAFVARFQELRLQDEIDEPLFDGVREVLEQLHGEGYLLGVATGKSKRGLIITLENHGLRDYFLTLNTADDGPGKPHPSMLLAAMREAGVAPENTLMIGDTTYDIEMALAAKVRAVGVSWGYHDRHKLVQSGAHYMLDHIFHLRRVLDEAFL